MEQPEVCVSIPLNEEEQKEINELMKDYKWKERCLWLEDLDYRIWKKGGNKKMEVVYNVKYKFKTNENKTDEEIKNIFNNKLLNVIMTLENRELAFKES